MANKKYNCLWGRGKKEINICRKENSLPETYEVTLGERNSLHGWIQISEKNIVFAASFKDETVCGKLPMEASIYTEKNSVIEAAINIIEHNLTMYITLNAQ